MQAIAGMLDTNKARSEAHKLLECFASKPGNKTQQRNACKKASKQITRMLVTKKARKQPSKQQEKETNELRMQATSLQECFQQRKHEIK